MWTVCNRLDVQAAEGGFTPVSSEGLSGVKRSALMSHRPDWEPSPFTELQVTSRFLVAIHERGAGLALGPCGSLKGRELKAH